MKRTILIIVLGCLSMVSFAVNNESNLLALDNLIGQRQRQQNIKQRMISPYLSLLRISKGNQLCRVYADLYGQYVSYRLDSALYYANAAIDAARHYGDRADKENAIMNLVEVKKKLGQFQDALDLLNGLNPQSPALNKRSYYHLYHSINYLLYLDAFTDRDRQNYKRKTLFYLNDLLRYIQPGTSGYVCSKSEEWRLNGNPRRALALLLAFAKKNPQEAARNSFLCYSMAETYHDLKQPAQEEYYLTLTSLLDLKDTKKEYMALQQLAVLLYKKGDVCRAYNYIISSMEDIVFCHARCRMSFVSESLPIISATYEYKMQKEARLRTIFITAISILLVFFVVVYVKLRARNRELMCMKQSLNSRNDELSALNGKLSELNIRLGESNRIKEEYIVQLFDLCSSYINKQKAARISMNRKIVAGKIEEVRRELNDTSMESEELKAFFHHFDEIFLKLFPDFIQSFNRLLVPGKEMVMRGNDLLSSELRIYALIRLGINDNSKIAELLHYSVQTVYNYRQRIRNKLAIPRSEFMNEISHLD